MTIVLDIVVWSFLNAVFLKLGLFPSWVKGKKVMSIRPFIHHQHQQPALHDKAGQNSASA